MKSGLLWYDADPRKPLWTKIAEAAQRYYEKFGVRPNTCFVNPGALPQEGALPERVETKKAAHHRNLNLAAALHVSAKSTILPNHIWLGVNDKG